MPLWLNLTRYLATITHESQNQRMCCMNSAGGRMGMTWRIGSTRSRKLRHKEVQAEVCDEVWRAELERFISFKEHFIATSLIIQEDHHGREKMRASVLRLRRGKRKRILLRSMQEHESIRTLSLQSCGLQGENFLRSQALRITTSSLSGAGLLISSYRTRLERRSTASQFALAVCGKTQFCATRCHDHPHGGRT